MSDLRELLLGEKTTPVPPGGEGAALADAMPMRGSFVRRHIGPSAQEQAAMLQVLGLESLGALIDQAVPANIRLPRPLEIPGGATEEEVLAELKTLASRNQVFRSFIGMGYHDCHVPAVIQRNILENPGWYTPYTPYQAEIAQGRLESLLNFQTMVADLTGLDIANASMLDEATAAAEAMTLAFAQKEAEGRTRFLISSRCHPQTLDVVRTRAVPLGIELVVADPSEFVPDASVFGALVQYPDTYGRVERHEGLAEKLHAAGGLFIVAADLLGLVLLRPPGDFGADIAVGSAQRFGVPLGYGGPHAGYFAVRDALKRFLPGRLVGVSKDAHGRPALRLSLQTREQHIRREKATSNICTAQALLANMAAMYAVYHGPEGLQRIARRVRSLALLLRAGLQRLGFAIEDQDIFDTVQVGTGKKPAGDILKLAEAAKINLRLIDATNLGISLDETSTMEEVQSLLGIFNDGKPPAFTLSELATQVEAAYPQDLARTRPVLPQAVFNTHHSETEMLRYIHRLQGRDLSLTHSMIPLGSCTMKLNATAEMLPVSWPEFSKLHPFAPLSQTRGYQEVFRQLEDWLAEVTGFAGVSLQPNAGSQGEYAGLLVIQQHHARRGEPGRNICLIPTSAHGTNPASAVMAGLNVVPVACDTQGNIDVADLKAKAAQHAAQLSVLMVTYPSTHGVFEGSIMEICEIVHQHGGQVYMDGANLNAQVGLCRPGDMGADVCHLNLHKTFCIPHGGGGPGMGPIGVAEHLVDFLPGHSVVNLGGEDPIGAVSAAPWGSPSILLISWVYIALMGGAGLTEATRHAILNANYIARRLRDDYPILYRGQGGWVAHECILDLRAFKSVTVEDVAKRLMDFGFHAPTVSWPVPGTIMVEPTESESKEELDRFCDAMLAIRREIAAIESGAMDRAINPLKLAPHTAEAVTATEWTRGYSREQAAFPLPWTHAQKFWPAVGRIDNVFGDRNLVCSCIGMDAYAK